jgi:hypothetical protein
MPVGPKFKFSLKMRAAYPNGFGAAAIIGIIFVDLCRWSFVQLRPLRCRIVLPIAVKSRKLEFTQEVVSRI